MRRKVSIVGAGNVGATTAQRLAELDLFDLALVDVVEGLAEGKALDMAEAGPIQGYDTRIVGGTDYGITEGSEIVVITSGLARKPGMSRDDLISANAKVVGQVTEEVVRRSPQAVLVIVTNPLDAMTELALRASGLDRFRVIGMAGILDTARFRTFLATELNVSVRSVEAYVLGGHGDSMVPLRGVTSVAGVPVGRMVPAPRLEEIVQRTRDGGAEIVKFLKTGSAYYAPSAAAAQMVEAIAADRGQILPCAIRLEGEYGLSGVVMGVPTKLGAGGVSQVIEVELTPGEREELERSAQAVREVTAVLP
ncbi:MAG: malate dehydrogenase [Candidatus Dormibacteraeota bacterium]|jgi:malate dehydrogenase|nr:malate dehydrogenase [Candidatus Dormibacteraeota bacterium]